MNESVTLYFRQPKKIVFGHIDGKVLNIWI